MWVRGPQQRASVSPCPGGDGDVVTRPGEEQGVGGQEQGRVQPSHGQGRCSGQEGYHIGYGQRLWPATR